MRNLWKGFIVGGTMGAVIGLVVDGGSKAKTSIAHAAEEVDLRGKASDLTDRVADSDALHRASDRVHQSVEPIAAAAQRVSDSIADRTSHT